MTRSRCSTATTARCGAALRSVARRLTPALLAAVLALAAPGCVAPGQQGFALVRASVRGPLFATDAPMPAEPKVGRSATYTFLGLFAHGDASVEAAARDGGITRIHHADYEYEHLLGLLAVRRTFVYGD